MFEFKVKSGIFPTADPLTDEAQRKFMFVLHRKVLNSMKNDPSRYLLITGATGLGKTTFINACLDHLEKLASQVRRQIITIRLTPHMPIEPQSQMRYLSGKLKLKGPNTSSPISWNVSLNPKVKIPTVGKVSFKLEANKQAGNPIAGGYPLDQQAHDAMEQLVKLATKKIPRVVGKPPIIALTIEHLTDPEMLNDVKEIFDANASLELENQIYFIVSGNLELHAIWWKQKSSFNALMSQFRDLYLSHYWALVGFCEQVIDSATISNRALLAKFANYLVVESNGNLRQIWAILKKANDEGVEEVILFRYERFYNLFFMNKSLMNDFVPSFSLFYSEAEYTDRFLWCVCEFIKWFTKSLFGKSAMIVFGRKYESDFSSLIRTSIRFPA